MKQINKKDFGEFVSRKRKEKNMTQKDIAEKLYVSVQAVSKWERGQSLPDISLLMPLAKILDVNLVNLLEARDEKVEDSQKVENLLEKIVEINKEDEINKGKEKIKRAVFLALAFIFIGIEYYFLYRKFNYDINNFLTVGILGVIFSIYLYLLIDERLPSYYDENKISFVSKGFFRINVVGISFSNKNWKPILKFLRFWIIGSMVIFPIIFNFKNSTSLILSTILFFASLFVPLYGIGKYYEWKNGSCAKWLFIFCLGSIFYFIISLQLSHILQLLQGLVEYLQFLNRQVLAGKGQLL